MSQSAATTQTVISFELSLDDDSSVTYGTLLDQCLAAGARAVKVDTTTPSGWNSPTFAVTIDDDRPAVLLAVAEVFHFDNVADFLEDHDADVYRR